MKSFVLFIYGVFEDHEDIEFFCIQILGQSEAIHEVRYVIESENNMIVIFDSDYDDALLSEEIYTLCANDNVKFYFLIEREGIVTSHLPEQVNNFMFKPKNIPPHTILKVEYRKKPQDEINLDEVLDKLSELGIDSLTSEERNFLDNFEK
jgi:hypothetical protein